MMNLSEEISEAQQRVKLIQELLVEEQNNQGGSSFFQLDDEGVESIDEDIDDDLLNERDYLIEEFQRQREEFLDDMEETADESEDFDRQDLEHEVFFLNETLFHYQKQRVSALCDLYASLKYAPVAQRHKDFLITMKCNLGYYLEIMADNLSDPWDKGQRGFFTHPVHEEDTEEWADIPKLRALISDTSNEAQKAFQYSAGRLLDDYLSVAVSVVREEVEFIAGYLFSCGDLVTNAQLIEQFHDSADLIKELTYLGTGLRDPKREFDLDGILDMMSCDNRTVSYFRPH